MEGGVGVGVGGDWFVGLWAVFLAVGFAAAEKYKCQEGGEK